MSKSNISPDAIGGVVGGAESTPTQDTPKLLGRRGRRDPEVNDGVPVTGMPGMTRPRSLQELIRQYVRNEVSASAADDGEETFDEADDFEEEDPDTIPLTHHNVAAMDDAELAGIAAGYGITFEEDREAPQEGGTPSVVATTEDAAAAPASGSNGGTT